MHMRRHARKSGRAAGLTLVLASLIVLGACGPQVVTGRAPFVGISSMNLEDDRLSTQFRVSNENGVPMTILQLDVAVTLDATELVRDSRTLSLRIDANSAEDLLVVQPASTGARERLESLQRGEVLSLPFALTGRARTEEDGNLRFEQKGHLYPVPGRPGQFRSAVTQAQELRRDEKL